MGIVYLLFKLSERAFSTAGLFRQKGFSIEGLFRLRGFSGLGFPVRSKKF